MDENARLKNMVEDLRREREEMGRAYAELELQNARLRSLLRTLQPRKKLKKESRGQRDRGILT
jgi:hypothetical protein